MKSSLKVIFPFLCCVCTGLPTFAQQSTPPQQGSILLLNLKSSEGSPAATKTPQPKTNQENGAKVQMRKRVDSMPSGSSNKLSATVTAQSPKAPTASQPQAKSVGSVASQQPPTAGGGNTSKATAPKTAGHEDLDALLWLRTSVEFDALTRQTFATATTKLGEALVDDQWNALAPTERSSNQNVLPPCVIVDVDETMLDNSQYQLELIRDNAQYDTDQWNQFVNRRNSPAIDGAVEFATACRTGGVKIFFVTNRDFKVEAATRDNLIAQGLMDLSDPDRILSKNEQSNWTSDKSSRRKVIAQTHRVLLLIGDDLNDFVSAKNLAIAKRQQLYLQNKKNWGKSWFVMPNPNYGSWESTTINNQYQATPQRKRELKMGTLLKPTQK